MHAVFTIVRKDVVQRVRDKSFFLLGIATPLVLAFIFNLVFGDVASGTLGVEVGVIDEDGSEPVAHLEEVLGALEDEGILVVTALTAGTDPEKVIEGDDLAAVVVVPAGFGEAVTGADLAAPSIRVVGNVDRPTGAAITRSVVEGFTRQLDRARIEAAAATQLGLPSGEPTMSSDVVVVEATAARPRLDPATEMTAGMAAFFLLFTVMFGVTTLLEERRDGTMQRLLAAPISRNAIVAAKGAVSLILGVVATGTLIMASVLLMGTEWGSPVGMSLLVVAGVLTAVGLMALVAGLARTPEGAGNLQSIIAVALGMLGGTFFALSREGVLGVLTRATPHHWFIGGVRSLAGDAPWTEALPSVAVLVGMAVALGIPAAVLVRRRLQP